MFLRTCFQNNADIVFGGVTIICGIVGTLAGGFVLDLMTATISNAFKVKTCFVSILCDYCTKRIIAYHFSIASETNKGGQIFLAYSVFKIANKVCCKRTCRIAHCRESNSAQTILPFSTSNLSASLPPLGNLSPAL